MSQENGREIISSGARVGVVLPLALDGPFDYRVPDGMKLSPGDIVHVPFGRNSVFGVVWGAGSGEIEEAKTKSVQALVAHVPAMSDAMRSFIDWAAWYTLAPRGMVLKMAISIPEALEPAAKETLYQLAADAKIKMTPSRQRIVAYLDDGIAHSMKEITAQAKVSSTVVREFLKAGGLTEALQEAVKELAPTAVPQHPELSADQKYAAEQLVAKFTQGFSVNVLDGVTGSGKTEVYFDSIEHCMNAGKQALVLLPEIGLSVQWLSRFKKRFGFAPELWHSHVSPARRRDSWRRIVAGEARVVVGARSALFLPLKSPGLIIVDEEHDASYKQEDGVIYHARDMAVARARAEKIPVVLVSATPSLESEHNIEQGRYTRLHLPTRHADAELPTVRLIDMRKEAGSSGNWLSDRLRSALVKTVADKSQAMLFLNRRGYAPLLLCRSCGHRFQCPDCAAWLVQHRTRGRLLCHHCGHSVNVPTACPDCKKENTLVACGPGVERVAEEVRQLLPEARTEIMTSDHMDTPAKMDALIEDMMAGKIDVLIGTQMIAKGHHFARLAMVGVIDADMSLAGGDLRAGERTYQLLHQLAGRAGREKTKGEVWLQTYLPEHPVMQALARGERDNFMQLEAEMRKDAEMPPYGKLAAIVIEGKNEHAVAQFARELAQVGSALPASGRAPLVLGPAPAPLALLRGRHRFRILVKTPREFPLQRFLADWLYARKVPSQIKVKIDVDPYSFI